MQRYVENKKRIFFSPGKHKAFPMSLGAKFDHLKVFNKNISGQTDIEQLDLEMLCTEMYTLDLYKYVVNFERDAAEQQKQACSDMFDFVFAG